MFAACALCQCLQINQSHWTCYSQIGPLLYCPALIEQLSPPVCLFILLQNLTFRTSQSLLKTCQKSTQFLLQLQNELHSHVLVGDYCEVNLCHNGGTCVTGVGEEPFVCICAEGFAGDTCTAKENGNGHITFMQ